MKIISSDIGFALKFKDKEDLKTVVNHLSGMLEWKNKQTKDKEKNVYPAVYAVANDTIGKQRFKEFVDNVKKGKI